MENLIQESSRFLSKKCHWNVSNHIKEREELKSDIVSIVHQNLNIFEGIDKTVTLEHIKKDLIELKSLYTLDENEFNVVCNNTIVEGWGSALMKGLGRLFGSSADDIAKGAAKGAASSADDVAKGAAKGSVDDIERKAQERIKARQERMQRAQQRKAEAQQRRADAKAEAKAEAEAAKAEAEAAKAEAKIKPKQTPSTKTPTVVKPPKSGSVVRKGLTGAAILGTGAAILGNGKDGESDSQQGTNGAETNGDATRTPSSSTTTPSGDATRTPSSNTTTSSGDATRTPSSSTTTSTEPFDIHKGIADLAKQDPDTIAATKVLSGIKKSPVSTTTPKWSDVTAKFDRTTDLLKQASAKLDKLKS